MAFMRQPGTFGVADWTAPDRVGEFTAMGDGDPIPAVIELGQGLDGTKEWSHTPWCFMHQASSLGLRYWLVPHASFNGHDAFEPDVKGVLAALAALDLTF